MRTPINSAGAKGLKEWSDKTDLKSLPEKAPMKKALMHGLGSKPKAAPKMKDKRPHGIHETHIQHLPDGSHVVKHMGPELGDGAQYSAPNMPALHDGLETNLGK